ncbi:ammonium transporter [Nocardia huaxiensis]|uniref:Ammonium transporter n=2 Tax=Nocardia huaxiensis TaxID=2755382 RepID=A0A7D6VDV0_9NOCA|nr:ammonium transporter [Nocardia huaxiensis]
MLRKITAVAAPVVTAVAIAGAGVAHAEDAVPNVGYETKLVGTTVVTTLTDGRFELSGGTVNVLDRSGNTLVSLPVSVQEEGIEYTLPATVSGDGATLEIDAVRDVSLARPGVREVASPAENLAAQQNFASQFGLATAIGSFIGLALGALVGLAGFAGGPAGLATVVTGATVGAIIGTVVVGGPTLVIAGIDLISTLTAAPGTTKWATK